MKRRGLHALSRILSQAGTMVEPGDSLDGGGLGPGRTG
jgi:hypothetical protein